MSTRLPVEHALCAVYPSARNVRFTDAQNAVADGITATLHHRALVPEMFNEHAGCTWRICVKRGNEEVLRYGNFVYEMIEKLPNMEQAHV